MKKILSIILVVSMLLTCAVTSASAEEELPEFEYIEGYSENEIAISEYNGSSEHVVIPETIDGLPVMAICADTFTSEDTIKSVVIPSSVTLVQSSAFSEVATLEKVEFLSDGKRNLCIEAAAFYNCPSLNEIILPSEKIYSISSLAFYKSAFMDNEANWQDNVLYLDDILLAVNANELIDNYVIKEGTTVIADDIFSVIDEETGESTRNIKNIILPESIQVIGEYAFISVEKLGDALERIGLYGEIRGLEFTLDTIAGNEKYTQEINDTGYASTEKLHIQLVDGDILLAAVPMSILSGGLVSDPMYIIPDGIRYISDDCNMTIIEIPGKLLSVSYSEYVVFPETLEALPLENPLAANLYNVFSGLMCHSVTFLNKDTVIFDHPDTITGWVSTICGYKGSTAEAYAKKYNRTFIDITNCTHEVTVQRGVIESTCERTGYTGDTYCAYCGQLISIGSKSDLHNLEMTHTESYNSDCYDTLAVYECKNCDYTTKKVYISGTGHTDIDFDGCCDNCGDYTEKALSCACKVCRMHTNHEDNFFEELIPTIIVFFWRLFRVKEFCTNCGLRHWNR